MSKGALVCNDSFFIWVCEAWSMESPLGFDVVHWDHKPGRRGAPASSTAPGVIAAENRPCRRPAFRFMGSPLGLATVHWDHEPNRPPARPRPRNQAIGSRTRTTTRTRTKGRFMESPLSLFAHASGP